jgi:hypothetical protein
MYNGGMSFKKIFKLPSPVELGKAKYNALPIRSFDPDCTEYTWEDWNEEVKSLYPIRYFIFHTSRDFILSKFIGPIKRGFYWLKCHLLPKHKHHLLDLRQPVNEYYIDHYRYGFIDTSHKMLYALFNLLKEHLDQKPYDVSLDFSLEEIANDPAMQVQFDTLQEAKALMYWWEVTRKENYQTYHNMLKTWSFLRQQGKNKQDADFYLNQIQIFEDGLQKTTDEMTFRLLRIRKNLWD